MDTSSRLAWPCGVFALWLGFIALTKQWAKADEEQLQTVVNVRMKHPPHGKLFNAMNRLGYCLFKQGNVKPGKELERAEDLLNRGYLELEHYIPQMPEHLRLEIVGTALQRLIEFYDGLGRAARADIFRNKLTELELKQRRPLLTTDYIVPL